MRAAALLLLAALPLFGAPPAGATGGSFGVSYQCQGQSAAAGGSDQLEIDDAARFLPEGPSGLDYVAIGDVSASPIFTDTLAAKVRGWAGARAQEPTGAPCESQVSATYAQSFLVDFTQVISNTGQFAIPYELDWEGANQGGSLLKFDFQISVDGNSLGSGLLEIDSTGGLVRSGLADQPTIVVTPLGEGRYRVDGTSTVTTTLSLSPVITRTLQVVTRTLQVRQVDVVVSVNSEAGLPSGAGNVSATSNFRDGLSIALTPASPNIVLSATPFLAATPAVQTRPQQGCILELNKRAAALAKATGREVLYCIQQRVKGRDDRLGPSPDVDACIDGDVRGKVSRQFLRALAGVARKCFRDPDQLPDFALPTTVAALAVPATGEPLSGVARFFGGKLDRLVKPGEIDPEAGKCQVELVKRYVAYLDAALKEAVKQKRTALAGRRGIQPVAVTDDLSERLELVYDDSRKLERKESQLESGVELKCQNALPQSVFPGCGAMTPSGLAACAAQEAVCRSCRVLNAVDGTSADCDMLDNALPDASCD